MNWQKAAVEDLRHYESRKESLENIKMRVAALQSRYQAIKCASSDSTPVMGGASRVEDIMLDNIVERQRLTHTYKAAEILVRLTERGLKGLDERERPVLDRFYVNRSIGHVEGLIGQLHLEKSQLYRIKEDALYKYTVRSYGLIDY